MSRIGWCLLLVLWGVGAVWGYWKAMDYASKEAGLRSPPEVWPVGCGLSRDPHRPTLVVFIHPKCPCTRATVRELDRLLARHQQRVTVFAIIHRPPRAELGWEKTDLLAAVNGLPGVQVIVDRDEVCHREFSPSTSGECLLYSADGRLQFHGGVTPARGHEGQSAGQVTLAALLLQEHSGLHHTAVYGCTLENSNCPQVSQ